VQEVLERVRKVEEGETDVVRDQLRRNGVDLITGTARFVDTDERGLTRISVVKTVENTGYHPTSTQRHFSTGMPKAVLSAEKYLIACGTRPLRRPGIPFDGVRVFDSDQLLWGGVKTVPKNLIVMGAGVIGMEYASMINVIPGTLVTIIDRRTDVLNFADKEVIDALMFYMRQRQARFVLGEVVTYVEVLGDTVVCHLGTGKKVAGDALLYTMGRQGNTDTLNLQSIGLEPDQRGLLEVNAFYQTKVPHIYAAGDCIGYPALASTSMEQGRRASSHMWEHVACASPEASEVKPVLHDGFLGRDSEQFFPYGIYTIPEVSMIGKTEQQLTAEKTPYEVGLAHFTEVAKGQMLGGTDGFLKLIFCPSTGKLLGVHAIGEGATEIVHIGQVIMSVGGMVDYFKNAVFNYPTFAEAYNLAAADGLKKLGRY
jgi:NAD(P) transhydrogenase